MDTQDCNIINVFYSRELTVYEQAIRLSNSFKGKRREEYKDALVKLSRMARDEYHTQVFDDLVEIIEEEICVYFLNELLLQNLRTK